MGGRHSKHATCVWSYQPVRHQTLLNKMSVVMSRKSSLITERCAAAKKGVRKVIKWKRGYLKITRTFWCNPPPKKNLEMHSGFIKFYKKSYQSIFSIRCWHLTSSIVWFGGNFKGNCSIRKTHRQKYYIPNSKHQWLPMLFYIPCFIVMNDHMFPRATL